MTFHLPPRIRRQGTSHHGPRESCANDQLYGILGGGQQHLGRQLRRREPLHRGSDSGIGTKQAIEMGDWHSEVHMLLFLLLPWMFFKILTSSLPVLAWAR
jgi:hypothetical protein